MKTLPSFIRSDGNGTILAIKVQPRASRTEAAGVHGEELRIRVAAPPVDSAANMDLVKFVAKLTGVAKSAVTLQRGSTNRHKLLHVAGIEPDQLLDALSAAGIKVSQDA